MSSTQRRATVLGVCAALVATALFGAGAGSSAAAAIPPAVDPGTPVFAGSATPIPAEPAAYNPSQGMLQAIYNADLAAGGTSFWMDRILARPFSNGAGETQLLTRGRALFMYTHAPGKLGFASSSATDNGNGGQGNGWAYRQPLAPATPAVARDLYTIGVSGAALTETTAQRTQFPSYYNAVFTRAGLTVGEKKFITDNNVAVTNLTLTNTGTDTTGLTLTASSPIATTASGSELTGSVTTRYNLTTIFPRFSGDGFTVAGTGLTRTVSLAPGASTTVKVQLGAVANEIPAAATDYQRFRALDPNTAWLTQLKEYNKFWVDNVPYLDLPDKNVEKISYYRLWENRFNSFDGNIPGNDYQFPVDLEGAFGYNNQISLTVPMRMQDLQYYRDPLYSYGPWLSQGEESGCQAFHDNPGNTGNWNNTYEQWTASQAWQSYLVHGGPPSIVANLAKYAECDVKGTLGKFDTNRDNLIEYSAGTLPGNDNDSVAFGYYGTRPQDRTETSLWYSGALAAAAEYNLLGNTAKANEMTTIANQVKSSILTNLWAPGPVSNTPDGGPALNCAATGSRATGRIGSGALSLCGQGEFATMPTGVLSGLSDFTISAWVNPRANTAWSRVWDFGTGTTANMFLTVSAGGGPVRFAITTTGGGGEQQINGTSTLPLNTWSHVTVTLSGNTGTLYVNGAAVGTNPNITLRPSSLGNTNNNWIGRSQYNDPALNGSVDDVNIYNRALSAAEVGALAGGQAGAGNVASYRFDEASGAAAVDSSGNGRTATVTSAPPPAKPTITCPGQVFLQKDLTTGSLVCWKDQQNFAPFIDGVAPNTDQFKAALRYYADGKEFGIMPVYTADQADKAAEIACGASCSALAAAQSNNFSNINATLQARLYSKALRDYPSQFITPEMYRKLIEWLAWNEDVGGDNRFPDNNEFFFNWDPNAKTLGRSFIHHDVLGSFNWMFTEDLAGLRARLDNTLELWPIDLGYDHFTLNNLSYHGSNLTVVWQQPGGTTFYPNAPAGYSVYLDGTRVLNLSGLAHVTWNAATGAVTVLDNSGVTVRSSAAKALLAATAVPLTGNARVTDAFQKAGVNLTGAAGSGATIDVARGKTASASFTTTTPAAQATSPGNAVDGFTTSAPPVTSGGFVGTNPIWGDVGSPNAQDWLQVDLGTATRVNNLKIYYYNNKAFGAGGNTYREPASYRVQFLSGTTWVDVPGATATPAAPAPNLNQVSFTPTTARQFRVLMTRQSGFAVGVKELQLFDIEPVQALLDDMKSFVAAEPIDGAARNTLTAQLPNVSAPYRAGRTDQAATAAGTLTTQITDLATAGRLTEDQAGTLLAAAAAITDHIRE
jgi:Concanavalin A-like lectin/glucanases superfamily/F5/8 type C domain